MAVSHLAATPCRAKIKHHVRGRNYPRLPGIHAGGVGIPSVPQGKDVTVGAIVPCLNRPGRVQITKVTIVRARGVRLVGYATRVTLLGQVAVGLALVAALLNAVFRFCLGCEMYLLIKRAAH